MFVTVRSATKFEIEIYYNISVVSENTNTITDIIIGN